MGKHAFNDMRKNKSKKFTPGMFYLHTVWSEKQLFMRATNTILGIRWNDRIIVIGIRLQNMLLSTYANFRLFAFLLKSFSVLKVSKSTILFQ